MKTLKFIGTAALASMSLAAFSQSDPNFQKSKELCDRIGFEENTPEYQNCVLELYDRTKADTPTNSANQETHKAPQLIAPEQSRSQPSSVDHFGTALRALEFATGARSSSRFSPRQSGSLCTLQSQSTSGMYRNCMYQCPGGIVTESVGAARVCAPTIRR